MIDGLNVVTEICGEGKQINNRSSKRFIADPKLILSLPSEWKIALHSNDES